MTQTSTLTSELARLCLPKASYDPYRKFAWADSICFLFLVIGIIGLKSPQLITRQVEEIVEVVPVIFTPPAEEPKVEPQQQPEEPDQTTDVAIDTPQVATVVAADPSAAAFAVPVEGPVILAPARFAAAPPPAPPPAPPKPVAKPKVTEFKRGTEGGKFPEPTYPRTELLDHHEGKVLLEVVVDPGGAPVSVIVKDSSGHIGLDRHVVQWVKKYWQWLSGEERHFHVPFEFQIR